MGFLKLASKRYSVRSYKPDEIEQEKLDAVIPLYFITQFLWERFSIYSWDCGV